jgi:hypothetical protein
MEELRKLEQVQKTLEFIESQGIATSSNPDSNRFLANLILLLVNLLNHTPTNFTRFRFRIGFFFFFFIILRILHWTKHNTVLQYPIHFYFYDQYVAKFTQIVIWGNNIDQAHQ